MDDVILISPPSAVTGPCPGYDRRKLLIRARTASVTIEGVEIQNVGKFYNRTEKDERGVVVVQSENRQRDEFARRILEIASYLNGALCGSRESRVLRKIENMPEI